MLFSRVSTLRLRKNSSTFQDTKNILSRMFYTARALVNVLYTASFMANMLEQVLFTRELHGDGDDGSTAVIGLNFITDTAVTAGMGTAFTVVPRER